MVSTALVTSITFIQIFGGCHLHWYRIRYIGLLLFANQSHFSDFRPIHGFIVHIINSIYNHPAQKSKMRAKIILLFIFKFNNTNYDYSYIFVLISYLFN